MRRPDALAPLTLSIALCVALFGCGGGSEDHGQAAPGAAEEASPEASSSAASTQDAAEPAPAGSENDLGRPLEHPELYYGLYANPETPDRQWFIAEATRPWYAEQAPEVPPGHLALGAMFGDVEPWHLKTLSDTEFEQARLSSFQAEPVSVRFELDADGTAIAMTFTDQQNSSEGRLERVGDLPEGFH